MLTELKNEDLSAFAKDGYFVARGFLSEHVREALKSSIQGDLEPLVGPAELEADMGYPGAPGHRSEVGGSTPRRLLHAYGRSDDLRSLALHEDVAHILSQLMGTDQVQLSQCHHNCVMTKYPGFSSATLWHQDIRYWSFERPELISVWYALGDELADNGALSVIPGTHVENFGRGRLDRNLFLRSELEENKTLTTQARVVELTAGDALFFHCRLFHAAGRNLTGQVKISPVFTYHAQDNQPIPETSSDRLPSIILGNGAYIG